TVLSRAALREGVEWRKTELKQPPGATGINWGPDGARLAVAGRDGKVALWELSPKVRTLGIWSGPRQDARAVTFSPGGKRMVTPGAPRTVLVWDMASRKPLLTLRGQQSLVTCVAFSPDGRRIAAGGGARAGGGRR